MIAGHSNGHPRRNIRTIRTNSIMKGETCRESSVRVIKSADPRRAKTAPKTFEATPKKITMLLVWRVPMAAERNFSQVSCR